MRRSGSRMVGRCSSGVAVPERLGDEVLVGHRDERHAHARHPPDLGRVHAARVDHHVGLDVAAVGLHAAHAPAAHVDPGHARVRVDVAAALARALGERVGEQARVEVAVGRQPRGAEHAVGGHQREALLRLLGATAARAAARTSSPSRPGAASPPSAPQTRRAAARRTRPSRSRASGRARPSPSSSASATPSRAAGRRARPSGTSSREVSWLRSTSTTSSQPSSARW